MFKKLLSSQLRINMASGVVTTVINTAVMLISYPIYLHYLGYEKLGVWMVLATVLTFVQMCNLGMGPAVTKLVAEEHGRGNIEAIQNYVTTSLWTLAATGGLALMGLLLFAGPIIGIFKLGPENAAIAQQLLPYMGVLTVYAFLVQILTATLSGLGRMDQVNYRDSFCRILAVVVAIVLLHAGYGIESLLIASCVSSIAMHGTATVLIRKIHKLRILRYSTFKVDYFQKLLHLGSGVFINSLLSMLISPFNKLMLSRCAGVDSVAIYEIVLQSSSQVRALFNSVFQPIMPEISRLATTMTSQSIARLRHINTRSTTITIVSAIPIYITVLAFAGTLLRIWLRGQYLDTIEVPFRVMLVAGFANLASIPAYYVLIGLGHVRQCVFASVISAATNLILVTTFATITGRLSVTLVAFSLALAWTISSAYSIRQARRATMPLCSRFSSCDVTSGQ